MLDAIGYWWGGSVAESSLVVHFQQNGVSVGLSVGDFVFFVGPVCVGSGGNRARVNYTFPDFLC